MNLSRKELEPGTDFVVVDMTILNDLLPKTLCAKCGMQALTIAKPNEQYGLAVKLKLACTKFKTQEVCFSLARVEGEGRIASWKSTS